MESDRSQPTVPDSREALLIAALRHANEVSGTLNDLAAEVSRLLGEEADDQRYNRLHDLLLRRCDVNSAVHLFIAASNLRIELPVDLRGEECADAG